MDERTEGPVRFAEASVPAHEARKLAQDSRPVNYRVTVVGGGRTESRA